MKNSVRSLFRARPSWLAALPSLFNVLPPADLTRNLPRLTPADRMAMAWRKTGHQMQDTMTAYAQRHHLRSLCALKH